LEDDHPREAQIKRSIKSLKSYGASSYASLADAAGNYVQMAGGGITCLLEWYDAKKLKHFRAFHDRPNANFPDGMILSFRAGKIPMQSDEWFMSEQIIAVFLAFLNGENFPEYVRWRDAPGFSQDLICETTCNQ